MRESLENIKVLIDKLDQETSSKIPALVDEAEKLIKACNKIDESWSGSFVGYHGLLYFKDFEKPKHEERFNGEWGGIPAGWEKKDPEEVKKRIENSVSESFSIDDLEKKEAIFKRQAESILNEIKIEFSPIDLTSMPKEKELLSEIEKFKFGRGKNYFIGKMIPTTTMTRDLEAIAQGICTPAHTYYLGLAQSVIDSCNSVQSFLQLIDRLVRQLQMKKMQPHPTINNRWNFINPFWLLWQVILSLIKIFKLAWKHKVVSGLIVILTLLAIDYSLAWKNLLSVWESIKFLWPKK